MSLLRLVLMGVSGSGKSSVGEALSALINVRYHDGDDLHPPANVAKMAAGIPLNDDDRWPWLDRIARMLHDEAPLIIGCSALRRSYRDRIRAGAGGPVRFVHLTGSREVLMQRMAVRQGHYMPASLLDSQIATLEPPGPDEGAFDVDIEQPVTEIAARIAAQIQEG